MIDIGGAVGPFSIDDTELGLITAKVVRIGSLAHTAGITISAPITRHAGYDTMTLIDDGPIGQTAPLSVAKLALQSSSGDVILTNANNDVDFIAGTAANLFSFTDVDGFKISAVDVRSGIFLGGADTIVLNAGGTVTQDAGRVVNAGELLLLGLGQFFVTDTGNDVSTLAANVADFLFYTDADDLTIGSVQGTNGVVTNGSNMAITTVNGDLTVTNTRAGADVDAGIGLVTLTAGSDGNDNVLDIQANAGVSGDSGINLIADNMSIAANVDASTASITVTPIEVGRFIELGGNDGANQLGLSTAEINFFLADLLRIGDGNAAGMFVAGAVAPTGTSTLSLRNNGTITDFAGGSITVTNLAIQSTGPVTLDEAHSVSNLVAKVTSGGLFFNGRTIDLAIGNDIDGLSDVTALGSVTLIGDDLNVNAGRSVISTAGSITLASRDSMLIAGGSSITADGTIDAVIDFDNSDGNGETATIDGVINGTAMNVAGDTDSDTFNITPSDFTPIFVDGNNPIPPASPGDTLNVDITGANDLNFTKVSNANGFSGSYAFSNRQTVSYQEIESLSPDGTQLSIQMTDSPDPVKAGHQITYTITVIIGNAEAPKPQMSTSVPARRDICVIRRRRLVGTRPRRPWVARVQ